MALTTLAEAKAYMGVTATSHDAEITRLINQADGVVQEMAGPALQRATFIERHVGGSVLLRRYPVVSITSVSTVSRGVLTASDASTYGITDPALGQVFTSSGSVEVTYVAGPLTPPAEAVDAALVFISYKYRRNHGGSESYMPSGVEGSTLPPMGTAALREQIRLALGPYVRGARVG